MRTDGQGGIFIWKNFRTESLVLYQVAASHVSLSTMCAHCVMQQSTSYHVRSVEIGRLQKGGLTTRFDPPPNGLRELKLHRSSTNVCTKTTSTSNPFLCAADFFLQLGSCKEAVRYLLGSCLVAVR